MQARLLNGVVAWLVALPLFSMWSMNDWRWWVFGVPSWMIIALVAVNFPVFSDRLPRRDGR